MASDTELYEPMWLACHLIQNSMNQCGLPGIWYRTVLSVAVDSKVRGGVTSTGREWTQADRGTSLSPAGDRQSTEDRAGETWRGTWSCTSLARRQTQTGLASAARQVSPRVDTFVVIGLMTTRQVSPRVDTFVVTDLMTTRRVSPRYLCSYRLDDNKTGVT